MRRRVTDPRQALERRLRRHRSPALATLAVTLAGHLQWGRLVDASTGGIRSRGGRLALAAVLVAAVASWVVASFFFLRAIHFAMALAGQPLGLLVMATLGGSLLLVVVATLIVMSSLFFSRDVPRLMPLPLGPGQMLGARFAALYVDVLSLLLVVWIPVLVAGASVIPDPSELQHSDALWEAPLRLHADPAYWLTGLWTGLTLPAAPLGLAAVLAVAVGRRAAVSRYRDLLYVIGGLLGLAVALGIQYLNLRWLPRFEDPAEMMRLMAQPNALIMEWARFYPPARWAAEAMGSGPIAWRLGRLALFTVTSVGVLLAGVAWAQRGYLQAVQGGLEETADRRRAADAGTARAVLARKLGRAASPVIALALREWRLLWRTPPFMMTAVANTVVPPLVVAMLLLLQPPELGALLTGLPAAWIAIGIAAVSIFMGGAGQISSTSVSREGRGFALVASLPVSPARQVAARLVVAGLFAATSVVLVVLAAWWALRPPIGAVLAGVGGGLIGCWPVLAGSLWIDLVRPVTRWDSPQQAMKGNINGLWSMLLALLCGGAAAAAGWAALRLGAGWTGAMAAGAGVLGVLGVVLTQLALRQAPATFGGAGEWAS